MVLRQTARPTRADRVSLRDLFWSAPVDAILDRRTVAAGLNRSVSWLEQLATKGGGPEYLKIGRHRVGYRKRDVVSWFDSYVIRATSTSAYPAFQKQK
jgi:hypothetical protein